MALHSRFIQIERVKVKFKKSINTSKLLIKMTKRINDGAIHYLTSEVQEKPVLWWRNGK